jgi:transcription elongation factor Elf1
VSNSTPALDSMTSQLIVEHYRCPKCGRSLIEIGFVFKQRLEVQTEYFVWWTHDQSAIRASYEDHMVYDDSQAPVDEATCGSCGTSLPTDVIAALENVIDR